MYIDRVTREVKEVQGAQRRDPLRAGARVDAHPAQLGHEAVSERAGELERRARALPDGSPVGGRRRRAASSRTCPPPSRRWARPKRPTASTRSACRTRPTGRASKDFIRGFGFQGGGSTDFNFDVPGYGAAFKKAVMEPVTSSRASPASARCCRASTTSSRSIPQRRGHVRHPRAEDHDVVGREREGR